MLPWGNFEVRAEKIGQLYTSQLPIMSFKIWILHIIITHVLVMSLSCF